MPTISDIAKLAKVSRNTVSRILNNDKSLKVSEDTRNQVISIAKQINYVPIKKRSKLNLRSKDLPLRGLKIGIINCYSEGIEYTDPFFSLIYKGITDECRVREEKLFYLNYSHSLSGENKQLDGLIILGKPTPDQLKSINDWCKHLVIVDHLPEEAIDSIVIDYEKGTRIALEHLIKLHHTDIGYIGGMDKIGKMGSDKGKTFVDKRHKTFEEFMKEKGLYNKERLYIGEWGTNNGYELMKKAIESGKMPTAFFVGSDSMAMGALSYLNESGIRVPKDIAIVGFDNVDLSSYTNPQLTSVDSRAEFIGSMSVKLLIEQVEGRKYPIHVVVPPELVVRKSCGSIPR